jgi:hypothetical protein
MWKILLTFFARTSGVLNSPTSEQNSFFLKFILDRYLFLYVVQRIKDEIEFIVCFVQDRSSETAQRTIETSFKPEKNFLTVILVTSEKT